MIRATRFESERLSRQEPQARKIWADKNHVSVLDNEAGQKALDSRPSKSKVWKVEHGKPVTRELPNDKETIVDQQPAFSRPPFVAVAVAESWRAGAANAAATKSGFSAVAAMRKIKTHRGRIQRNSGGNQT